MAQGAAVVTGASAGIGALYARALAARGHDVVLVARRADRLASLAEELQRVRGEALAADLTQLGDVERVAERCAADDVAVLVNNAGYPGYAPFHQVDPGMLQQLVAIHITAPLLCSRAALPGMLARGAGAIVNVSSLLAFSATLPPGPLPHRATYAGAKAFLVHFTRTLAAELPPGGPVQVQVLCPGMTQTEFNGGYTTGMQAGDVVTASLRALERREVVCVPGLEAPEALEALAQAEAGVRAGAKPTLAARYRAP